MSTVQSEIAELEERLRLAELGPNPEFFEEALADDVVLVAEDGQPFFAKSKVVEAHQPGTGPKFTRVEMSNMNIVEHGTAAVVTCQGAYESPQSSVTLKFMRVWCKKNNRWQHRGFGFKMIRLAGRVRLVRQALPDRFPTISQISD
jgi:hypothetical protein